MVSGAWVGMGALQDALTRVTKQADAAAAAIVAKSAAKVEAAAKGNFAGAHRKGEPRVNATVDGHPAPNVVTGNLRRSIKHDPIRRYGFASYGTRVGPTAVYGRRVELAYRYAYFNPAVRAVRPELTRIAASEWAAFLRA